MALSPIHGLGANSATGPTPVRTTAPATSGYVGGAPGFGPGGYVPPNFALNPVAAAIGTGAPIPAYAQTNIIHGAPSPAAPAPVPAPDPGSGGGGFNSIDTFPGVANALALEQQGIGQLDAQLNSQRQQAIINFGDPALAQMAGFGLDPQAAAFAQQNYLSGNATMARLDKSHKLASQAVVNALAAHGLLGSGDLGYREGQENQSYGNNVYDAQQSVLSQLAGLYNNYLSSRYGLEENANSAQLQALQMYLQNPDMFATGGGGGGGGGGAPAGPAAATATAPAAAARRALAGRRATPLPNTRVKGGKI